MNKTKNFSLILIIICLCHAQHRTFRSKSTKSRVSRCVLLYVMLLFVNVHVNQPTSFPKRQRTRS